MTFNAGLAVGLDPYALERLDNIDYALQRLSVLLSALFPLTSFFPHPLSLAGEAALRHSWAC